MNYNVLPSNWLVESTVTSDDKIKFCKWPPLNVVSSITLETSR